MHCWWKCRLVQPLWKTVWNFLKELKMELLFDPAIPLLGLYPKNPETSIQKNCSQQHYLQQSSAGSSLSCSSVNEWYIYTMEYYTVERKKELLPFTTAWMELESIMLSEISHVVRDKYHMISLIRGT